MKVGIIRCQQTEDMCPGTTDFKVASEGKGNPIGFPCPPMVMVGIVPSRYSYHLIKESGCFVVNLVTEDYKKTFDHLGSHSKRDEDKLAAMNVKLSEGKKVNAPVLEDCPVNIECTVVDSIVTGSHEMFVGKIEYIHAAAELLDAEGNIDFSAISFLG